MTLRAPENDGHFEIEGLLTDSEPAALSGPGAARRDAILADVLRKAPGIRRARAARRATIGAAPVFLLLLLVLAFRPWPSATRPTPITPEQAGTHGSPIAHAEAPAESEEHSRGDSAPPRHFASIVSTADRVFTDRIVSTAAGRLFESRVEVRTIDDETLLALLALEGREDGVVRIGDRTMLASELASRSAAQPAHPASPEPPIPRDRTMLGL